MENSSNVDAIEEYVDAITEQKRACYLCFLERISPTVITDNYSYVPTSQSNTSADLGNRWLIRRF